MALSKIQFFSSDYVKNPIFHVIISSHSNKVISSHSNGGLLPDAYLHLVRKKAAN